MALIVSAANGLFTNASTWAVCDTAGSRTGNVTTATALATANTNTTAFTASTNTQVDGVALRINLRGSGTPTNTLRVWLRCHSNTTDVAWCNVAVSELPYATSALQNGGWIFFKFGSPHILATGNSYSIVCNLTATSTSVSLQSANTTALATAQLLRSTTAQAPAPGDDIYIVGEWDGSNNPATPVSRLVTMDETTANDYGSNVNESNQREAIGISKNAILRVGGPNAGDPPANATNYYLKLSGSLTVFSGGQLDLGTVANPIPRDSSCIIEFDTAASKQYGLRILPTSIFNAQGLSRADGFNIFVANLTSNMAIANTTVNIDQETGWLSGDEIVLAPTSRTYTDYDFKALSNNAATGTLTVNSGVTYAHLGTSPYWCEVGLLSRNIKIRAANPGSLAYASIYHDCNTDVDWTEWSAVPITTYYDAVNVNTQFHYCSFRSPGIAAALFTISNASSDAFIIRYGVFFGHGYATSGVTVSALTTKTNWRVSDCYAFAMGGIGFSLTDEEGNVDNLYGAGAGGASSAQIALLDTSAFAAQQGNTANLYAHSGGIGVNFAGGPRFGGYHNIIAWRNAAGGVLWGAAQPYQQYVNRKLTVFAWGNANYNLTLVGSFINCAVNGSMAGETAFATTDGVKRTSPGTTYISTAELSFDGMSFGIATGANTTHANNDVNWSSALYEKATLYFKNCLFSSANEIGGFTTSGYGSSYHLSRWDQVSGGSHKSFFLARGTITCNTTTYRTAAPSEQLTPAIVAPESKMESGIKRVALTQAATANVSVYVRKDSVYNGTAPRLMQRANPAIGVTNETVLATSSLTLADTWYLVTGTTAAVTDDGVIEVYVDCDGTAGNIFVDDWSVA